MTRSHLKNINLSADQSVPFFRRPYAVSSILLAMGLCVSFGFYSYLKKLDSLKLQRAFEIDCGEQSLALQKRVNTALSQVEALAIACSHIENLTRKRFEELAQNCLVKDSGTQALKWVPFLAHAVRPEYERAAQEYGFENFQIQEFTASEDFQVAPARPFYSPIYFVEPIEGNEQGIGLDLAAIQKLKSVLEIACDLGEMRAFSNSNCVLDPDGQGAFLAFVPVYNGSVNSREDRRRRLRGYAVGLFRVADLFSSIAHAASRRDLLMQIVDVSRPSQPLLLGTLDDSAQLKGVESLKVARHNWEITFSSAKNYADGKLNSRASVALISGILLSLAAAAGLFVLLSTNSRVQKLVVEKTGEAEAEREKAQAASKAKSEFLANMSHEIRTPMTAIIGFAEIILDENESQERKEDAARTVSSNGQHLLSLINDILDLSKLEAGKLEVESLDVDCAELLSEVKKLMQVRADSKGLSLSLNAVSEIPSIIKTDPTRLRQILVNIIGNAIKFTEVGEIKVECSYLAQSQSLEVAVIDQGIGMTEEQSKRIFNSFEQADTKTTRNFGGTGLGLSISRRLARLLGGDIGVACELNKGCRFVVCVQAGQADISQWISKGPILSVRPAARQDKASAPSLDQLEIMLAEDGPDNQRLVSHILKKAGAKVTLAENGKIAMETALERVAAGQAFDAILMDMQMPVMDGYTAVSNLRVQSYEGPIIAFTAHAMSSDREKCLDCGCDEFATKPVNKQKLFTSILNAIELRKQGVPH